jgi:hypothetical protein
MPSTYYDGNFTVAAPCGNYRIEHPIKFDARTVVLRQKMCQFFANWVSLPLNSFGPNGNNTANRPSYLVEEGPLTDEGAGIVTWDRVYATVPFSRSSDLSTEPGRWMDTPTHQHRAMIGIQRQYSGILLIDLQIFSVSVSTWVRRHYFYNVGYPTYAGVVGWDGPYGTILHFPNGQSFLDYGNGFSAVSGTFGVNLKQSWAIRVWMGNIWETTLDIG